MKGLILGLYWGYIRVILGLYWGYIWDYIRAILGFYWGYVGVILGLYSDLWLGFKVECSLAWSIPGNSILRVMTVFLRSSWMQPLHIKPQNPKPTGCRV